MPVYTVASAAREIVATIGEKIDVETVQRELAVARRRGQGPVTSTVTTANFFKHADRDADATLDFDENDAEIALQLACYDFGRITGGIPIAAQIYEAWITTIAAVELFDARRSATDRGEHRQAA